MWDQRAVTQSEDSEVGRRKQGQKPYKGPSPPSRTENDHFGLPCAPGTVPGITVLLTQNDPLCRRGNWRSEKGSKDAPRPQPPLRPEPKEKPARKPAPPAPARNRPHRPAGTARAQEGSRRQPRTCPSWSPRRRARGARPPPTPAARPRAAPRPRPPGASPLPPPRRTRRPSPRPGRRPPAAAPAGTPCRPVPGGPASTPRRRFRARTARRKGQASRGRALPAAGLRGRRGSRRDGPARRGRLPGTKAEPSGSETLPLDPLRGAWGGSRPCLLARGAPGSRLGGAATGAPKPAPGGWARSSAGRAQGEPVPRR